MTRYGIFLTFFIISVIAFILFMAFYFQAFFNLAFYSDDLNNHNPNPADILRTIFSPAVIISFIVMAISTLVVRILGIVQVANNKTVSDGEKAIWIVGFIIMGFVTSIVFLIMAKGKKFV